MLLLVVDMKSVAAFRSLFDDNQKGNVDNRDIQSNEDIMRHVNSQMSRLGKNAVAWVILLCCIST